MNEQEAAPTAGVVRGPAREDRLLVWVGDNAHAEALVRHAGQWVANTGMPWTAIAVQTPGSRPEANGRRPLLRALELGERLGAATASVAADNVLDAVVERVRQERATMVMIGGHPPDGWLDEGRRHWLGDLADGLSKRLPDVTVTVVQFPAAAVGARPAQAAVDRWRLPWPALLLTAAVVLLCTALSALLERYVDVGTIDMVYLAGIVFVALRLGQTAAVLAVIGSLLMFDLIFVPPRWSLVPNETDFFFTFAVMLAIGLVVARLVAHARLQAQVAAARARRTQALNALARELVGAKSERDIAAALAASVRATFGAEARLLLPDDAGRLRACDDAGERSDGDAAAQRLFERGSDAGDAPGEHDGALLLLRGAAGPLAVLALRNWPGPGTEPEDRQLLDAFANQTALALERQLFDRRSARAVVEAEGERLRSTLLSGISHDLRTPLTTIIGAATSLRDQNGALDEARRARLVDGIVDEARRMHASMSDLLELTRLEEGAVQPACEWCPADELVGEVIEALGQRLRERHVRTLLAPEAIVWCDSRLVQQLLFNLLDNALRHTERGGQIEIRIETMAQQWRLVVSDDGCGLPVGHEADVFKKFFRAAAEPAGSRTGLGLAICAAVARLHGGRIEAHNAGGACFTLTLPQPAAPLVPADEVPA